MNRFDSFIMLALGFAIVVGFGCTSTVASGDEQLAIAEDNRSAQADTLPSASIPCGWECTACDDGDPCVQTCTEVGSCGSTCSVIAQCAEGYAWDDASCSCVGRRIALATPGDSG